MEKPHCPTFTGGQTGAQMAIGQIGASVLVRPVFPLAKCSLSVPSYHPDLLLIVATVAVCASLAARGRAENFGPAPVVYPTLLLFFALLAWLIFFRN
jgi:hypothetical protein